MSTTWTGTTLVFGVVMSGAAVAQGVTPAAAGDADPVVVEVIVSEAVEAGEAPQFEIVETEVGDLIDLVADTTDGGGVELHTSARLAWQPTDPDYALQWTHHATGLEQAWDITRGSADVVIAVLDTGVAPDPDLGDRLLEGVSFVDADPHVDVNGHGTSVAVIAAASHDAIGIAGVCPKCSILPVQVGMPDGLVPWGAAADGIVHAVDHGADIINLSFGSESQPTVVEQAVQYALANDVIVVAAAGNGGSDRPFYPAAMPGVISVGAHDSNFGRYGWSNFGEGVDLAAPGCGLGAGGLEHGVLCGTSFAAPWAAGVAGLLLAAEEDLPRDGVEQRLEQAASPLSWVEAGWVDAARVFSSPADGAGFVDVPEGAFYAEAVGWMVGEGLTTGTAPGRFSPDDVVTRAQLATFLWRLSGQPTAAAGGFDDVDRGAFYAGAVDWMVAEGLTTGTAPGRFSPDDVVTRAQLATFLWRLSGQPTAAAGGFDDVDRGAFYAGAVDWMVAEGLTTGTAPGRFSPDDVVTRGQLATFLWRLAG